MACNIVDGKETEITKNCAPHPEMQCELLSPILGFVAGRLYVDSIQGLVIRKPVSPNSLFTDKHGSKKFLSCEVLK